MKYRLALDANVVLDGLLQRGSSGSVCLDILELAEQKQVSAYISSGNLLTVMYFLKKEGKPKLDVAKTVESLLAYLTITSAKAEDFLTACRADFTDLEDAVQYFTALNVSGIDYFITSNTKDFKRALPSLPVVDPKRFWKIWTDT